MTSSMKKVQILAAANAALVLVAMVLSIVSSGKAYAFDIRSVILCCAATAVLDLLCVAFAQKFPGTVTDIALFITAVLTAFALCIVIQGRILLIGYIYFPDLESSNPIAISAMNLAIVSWVFYVLALIINFIVGFSKRAND